MRHVPHRHGRRGVPHELLEARERHPWLALGLSIIALYLQRRDKAPQLKVTPATVTSDHLDLSVNPPVQRKIPGLRVACVNAGDRWIVVRRVVWQSAWRGGQVILGADPDEIWPLQPEERMQRDVPMNPPRLLYRGVSWGIALCRVVATDQRDKRHASQWRFTRWKGLTDSAL